MITLITIILNKLFLGEDEDVYFYCIVTAIPDGLFAWFTLNVFLESILK